MILTRPQAARRVARRGRRGHPRPVPEPAPLLAEVERLAAAGYRLIPVAPGVKRPLVRWKRFQAEPPTPADYQRWFARTRVNVAAVCGEHVVVDVDAAADLGFAVEAFGRTPLVSRTPRGGYHLHFRAGGAAVGNRVRLAGRCVDVRGAGGYAVLPPSVGAGGVYRWEGEGLLPVAALPVVRTDALAETTRRRVEGVVAADEPGRHTRARAYLAKIEGAVSGLRGHDRTFRVACVLVRKFGLTPEQAWPLFLEWNARCDPPWSEAELTHKLESAAENRR